MIELKEPTVQQPMPVPSRDNVHLMFDRISRRYDFLNHLLSFGLDIYWRKQAIDCLDGAEGQTILDLACGTGDLAITAITRRGKNNSVFGIDKSAAMLFLAKQKALKIDMPNSFKIVRGDGMALPLKSGSINAAMIAFGIRNMPDTLLCLKEISGTLRTKGRLIVLEFSLPENRVIRAMHLFYLRNVIPFLGRVISGDNSAYRYLNRTIETYPHGDAFCELMRLAGFKNVSARRLTFGIVSLYTGEWQ